MVKNCNVSAYNPDLIKSRRISEDQALLEINYNITPEYIENVGQLALALIENVGDSIRATHRIYKGDKTLHNIHGCYKKQTFRYFDKLSNYLETEIKIPSSTYDSPVQEEVEEGDQAAQEPVYSDEKVDFDTYLRILSGHEHEGKDDIYRDEDGQGLPFYISTISDLSGKFWAMRDVYSNYLKTQGHKDHPDLHRFSLTFHKILGDLSELLDEIYALAKKGY